MTAVSVSSTTRRPFEDLKEKVFPELVKRRAGDEPLRVWVIGFVRSCTDTSAIFFED